MLRVGNVTHIMNITRYSTESEKQSMYWEMWSYGHKMWQ